MADIYAFPTQAPARDQVVAPMDGGGGLPGRPVGVPDEVWSAVTSVRAMKHRDGVHYREIGVPRRLGDFGIGVELQCEIGDTGGARVWVQPGGGSTGRARSGIGVEADGVGAPFASSGWIMLLYSDSPSWKGDGGWAGHHRGASNTRSPWRCLAFANITLGPGERDAMVPAMYWDEMCDHLRGVESDGITGTVTMTQDTPFGAWQGEPRVGCEMRVSWIPAALAESESFGGCVSGIDAGAVVDLWASFLQSSSTREDVGIER